MQQSLMRPPTEIVTSTDAVVALDDENGVETQARLHPLIAQVQGRFAAAKRYKKATEDRHLKCYYNFRGLAGKEIRFREDEKSRIFVKVTKTKVLAAYGQVMDVLFSSGRIPITIEPTDVPDDVEERVHVDMDDAKAEPIDPTTNGGAVGFPGDGKDLVPGETLTTRVGNYLLNAWKGAKFKTGAGVKPKSVTFDPAKIAAKKMEQKIFDQLEEAKATNHISYTAFECVLLGTGILKGPFTVTRDYPKWEAGKYTPLTKDTPDLTSVSCWNFYPDPEAKDISDVSWVIERHKMSRTQMRALKRRPMFRHDAIDRVLSDRPNWVREWWETELDDNQSSSEIMERYEALEYWGVMDADMVREFVGDSAIPKEMEDFDEFNVNAWICGNEVLRCVLNPFTPVRIPYLVVPYETNPYNLFGVGAAENMEDCQTLINGFTRLLVDNAVLAGGIMLDVDESMLVPGTDMKLFSGKVFRRQGGQAGQAVHAIKFPNTIQENMAVIDKFRSLADESVGIPSYSHGQTGITGTNRTAAGVSMLMGASALNIKTVVKNIDNYLLRPLGEALFAWNMQFDYDESIKGDLAIKARGTASLMMREVKSQRLLQFYQISQSPTAAAWVKFPTLLREIAMTLDIDAEKLINNPEEAALQAAMLGKQAGGSPMMGHNGGPPLEDPGMGGGGNIGAPAPKMPGEESFSGAPPASGGPQ